MKVALSGLALLLLGGCATETVPAAAPVPRETVIVTAEPAPTVTVAVTETAEPEPEPVAAAPVYVAPDPAAVAQFIKGVFADRLGRSPASAELQSHIDWYMEEHTYGGDTDARYLEMFEVMYGSEMDFLQDKEDAQRSRESVQGGADTMSCMSNPDQYQCEDD